VNSDNDPRSPILAQALVALLVLLSPMLESLSFCPVGYEEPKLLRLEAEADGEPLPIADYVFKHFLEQANIRGRNMPFLQNLRAVRFLVDPNTRVYQSSYYQPYDLFTSLNLVRRLPAVESVYVDAIPTRISPASSHHLDREIIPASRYSTPAFVTRTWYIQLNQPSAWKNSHMGSAAAVWLIIQKHDLFNKLGCVV
jgi:hypothetical protein